MVEKTDRRKGNYKGRPKHPPCPACGKAMYKQMGGLPVSPEAPWAFCRNSACELYGKNQAASEASPPPRGKVEKLGPKIPLKVAKPIEPPPAPVPKPVSEAEAVKRARARIREALNVNGAYTKAAVGLTLTLVAQELGDNDIANNLIDEFNLTESFGIEKRAVKAG